MSKSLHNRWLHSIGQKHRIFSKSGKKFNVLEFQRYKYTPNKIDELSKLIRSNLTDNFISDPLKKKFPYYHHRWKLPYFGLCVPATFSLLYLMNTDALEPMQGKDVEGLEHWWLRDINTQERYDLTYDQFLTEEELDGVYETGKPKGYYGFGEMPAVRILNLIQKVQPQSKRWITTDYKETPIDLEIFSKDPT
jgi:hypothetical protein